MSSKEEQLPREKRTREREKSESGNKAETTWEGVTEPLEQAEPPEAQIPSRSKELRREMLSKPGKAKEAVLKRRPEEFLSPRKMDSLRESREEMRSSVRGEMEEWEKTGVLTKSSMAVAIPNKAGRFSVPARRSFS